MGRGSRGARGWPALLLLLLLPARGARAPPGPPRPPGEPVTPRWVLDGRPRPVATPEEPAWKPDVGLVALEAEGQDLLLELEKNHRLLAPGYTETLYSPDGQSVELVPKAADHCHYHGRVRGFPGSWIALSTCAGLRGLIVLGDDASYYLHPPAPRATASTHRLFRMEQLLGRKRACGQREPGGPGGTAGCPRVPPSRERREAPGSPRYLELYLVADHALFLTQHRNFSHTKQRLLDVANYVDQVGTTAAARGEGRAERRREERQERAPLPAAAPADAGHPGGPERPGGVDGAGPQPRQRRRQRHAAGLPAVAPRAVGAAAARLGAAAHGPRLPGRHRGPGARRGHVQRGELGRRELGPRGPRGGRRSHHGPRDRPQPGPEPRPRRLLRGGPHGAGRLRHGGGHGVRARGAQSCGRWPVLGCVLLEATGTSLSFLSCQMPSAAGAAWVLPGGPLKCGHSPGDPAPSRPPGLSTRPGSPGLCAGHCRSLRAASGRVAGPRGGASGRRRSPRPRRPRAARRHPFPRVFSACSRRQLRAFFRKGGGACLSNAPEPGLAVRRPRCGNGFVEAGEECDCGDSQECLDPCCLAHNCSLRAGAQCARGDCCALCLLRPAGVLCRLAAGDCDLPEFCTGASALCPPDVYVLDGSPCAGGRGYCRDGACPTLEQQCQQLWGPGSHPAPETCFQIVNSAGDAHEDGGGDSEGHAAPRVQRDARCGKLQCQGGERSPRAPHAARVDSTVHLGGRKITCTGAVALPGAPLDLPGLGLVETGTQCGPGMVCQDGRCQNATSPELERCLSACHGHGVCNSNHHCHCRPGWAPPSCEQPGPGGSVDSGPVQPAERDAFLPAVLLSFLLPLLPGAGLAWCYYRHPPACLRRPVRLAEAPCELRVPNPNPAPGERRLLR
ncbi:disintegrin and metalloproteinase domain-containing protein 33 isoform X2 [Dasypus novemcinctus]|uniref:disintegrin and metalloproteinase domain-containing protein 33 isoform X2 n=1 Tax=Dasypus novemcinctus TaxID=9361 RepID=UPI0026602A1D|nr:disintegrin and metalloproteinase domain-containing protein 33 isoform X2 [Dasypus novemcinctus]